MIVRSLDKDTILVGKVTGVRGLKGQVRIASYTRPRSNILSYLPWTLVNDAHSFQTIPESGYIKGKSIIVSLKNVSAREPAEGLIGSEILVSKKSFPSLQEGTYYWDDLIGLSVFNLDGVLLGKIRDFMETGAHDIMCVDYENNQHLIPFVMHTFIVSVNLVAQKVVVNWEI